MCARGVIIYIFIVKSEIVQNFFVIFDRNAPHSGGPLLVALGGH